MQELGVCNPDEWLYKVPSQFAAWGAVSIGGLYQNDARGQDPRRPRPRQDAVQHGCCDHSYSVGNRFSLTAARSLLPLQHFGQCLSSRQVSGYRRSYQSTSLLGYRRCPRKFIRNVFNRPPPIRSRSQLLSPARVFHSPNADVLS